ncbi:unnamed protein product [Protopolystoma xenopodis]|uniref:Uncharacterized protein n=1 Tax=Protopolystoma xenopodis TaxID=117903 RepID=A0A448XG31_9PLAT|nr:unnamed protein product [Protopolystoma xenopodis]
MTLGRTGRGNLPLRGRSRRYGLVISRDTSELGVRHRHGWLSGAP